MLDPTSSSDERPEKKFQFIAGVLCLDFCNTVGGKRGVVARENLNSYVDFLSWCEQAGLIRSQRGDLKERAARDPGQSESVLKRAIGLREASYEIFLSILEGKRPAGDKIGLLNSELARSMGHLRIVHNQDGTGFGWEWETERNELDQPLGPLAHSAASLLASEKELAHVRQCRGENCGWLFVDCSKNHSRCWCDMRDCGNRAKVRRHRQRHSL